MFSWIRENTKKLKLVMPLKSHFNKLLNLYISVDIL